MKNFAEKIRNVLFGTLIILTGAWMLFALSFQLYGVYLVASNQEDEMGRIANEISYRIDGTFKDNPKNIWYKK